MIIKGLLLVVSVWAGSLLSTVAVLEAADGTLQARFIFPRARVAVRVR